MRIHEALIFPGKGVSKPVLQPAVDYRRNIDKQIGDRIAKGVIHD
jgi:hypothetical protein